MTRSCVNVSLDTGLTVAILQTAWLNRCSFNEALEEIVYRALREAAEKDPDRYDFALLDDLYGQIHQHWESQRPRRFPNNLLPF